MADRQVAQPVTAGVLLVRRRRWWSERNAARPREPALPLTEDEVARRYRGVDGEPWLEAVSKDVEHVLAEVARYDELRRTATELTGRDIFDAVVVTQDEEPPRFSCLGYDVGWVGEYGMYSSIFHESLNGTLAPLRAHATHLNSALLLPGRAEVDAYLETRRQLLAGGADVERARPCEPLRIWQRPVALPRMAVRT